MVLFWEKKYKINEILFDKNPKNQTIYIDGKSISLYDYYSKKYNFKIKEMN